MKNQEQLKSGLNRTGTMMSPIDAARSLKGAQELTTPSEGYGAAIAENRIRFALEAEPMGTVPLPTSPKGMKTAIQGQLATGNNALIDKLGERLAFERSGVRLYEALLSKYHSTEDKSALPPLELLERFYEEELMHFLMINDVMIELGADPTAMTPSANVAGCSGMGWVNVITDPRSTFLQSLDVILMAELVDNGGWEMLIDLVESSGLESIAKDFRRALEEEQNHLVNVKDWCQRLLSGNPAVVDVKGH